MAKHTFKLLCDVCLTSLTLRKVAWMVRAMLGSDWHDSQVGLGQEMGPCTAGPEQNSVLFFLNYYPPPPPPLPKKNDKMVPSGAF